jgi:hypothetical protein
LPVIRKYHYHDTGDDEGRLGYLVKYDPYLLDLVYQVRGGESNLLILLLPVLFKLFVLIIALHVTVDTLNNNVILVASSFFLIPPLCKLLSLPEKHLFLDIDSNGKVYQISKEFLPYKCRINSEPNYVDVLPNPHRPQFQEVIYVQGLSNDRQRCKLISNLHEK